MALTRDAILGIRDLKTEKLFIEEWEGEVYVRGFTAKDRDEWEAQLYANKDNDADNMRNLRAKLCVRCIVDENGTRIFKDEDADALGNKSAQAVAKVFEVASRLAGMRRENVEEASKNSEGGPSAASTSGLH